MFVVLLQETTPVTNKVNRLIIVLSLYFRTPDAACLKSCEEAFIECVADCAEDPTCLSQCSRNQADCITGFNSQCEVKHASK